MQGVSLHATAQPTAGPARLAFLRKSSAHQCRITHLLKLENRPLAWQPAAVFRISQRCHAVKFGKDLDLDLEKEKHKIFDEVFITVRSGDGGNGEIVEASQGKFVTNHKYKAGGSQPKKIWLPASDPADGADGADVVLVCDPSRDNMLHLHQRKTYTAPKGANANPAVGSAGPKNNAATKKARTPPLEIPVPPGTVVKRKSNGQLLGELVSPGDRLLVGMGGRGGSGAKLRSKESKQRAEMRSARMAREAGAEVIEVEDRNWKQDVRGMPGQQLGLHLLLRVVADVGIVGCPNAGKSSLLKALTRASPEVAAYPFTTLMPNLGVMQAGGWDSKAVLADLPGLIEGAHQGRGLGRMFLRHLRRTRIILHVVDAAAEDPATDYLAVREELRLYNPDYCARPHVVALNKMDLEDAGGLVQELQEEVMAAALRHQREQPDNSPLPPLAIIPCSAMAGIGLQQLQAALTAALQGRRYRYQPEAFQYGSTPAGAARGAAEAAASSSAGSGVQEEQQAAGWADGQGAGDGEEDEYVDEQELAAFLAEMGKDFDPEQLFEDLEGEAQQQEQQQQRRQGDQAAASTPSSSKEAAAASSSRAAGGSTRSGRGWSSSASEDAALDEGEVEVAPANDEDLWMLGLSEDELLKLEAQ